MAELQAVHWLDQVAAFHEKFGIDDAYLELTLDKLVLRGEMMLEEVTEFLRASRNDDFPEQIDALIDLIYFALGTFLILGVRNPRLLDELFAEVQRANMSKVLVETAGVDKRRAGALDIAKPEGWTPPDLERILDTWVGSWQHLE